MNTNTQKATPQGAALGLDGARVTVSGNKITRLNVLDAAHIGECTSGINIALMDANVVHSSILNLIEDFEYEDKNKAPIDALYSFARFLDQALTTIKELNLEIERAAYPNSGAK